MIAGLVELRELGAGAQGRVVLARAPDSEEVVAVKELPRELLGDEATVGRFRDEAAMLSRVANPYVARLIEYVERPEGAAIVMEAVNGVSLRKILDEHGAFAPEAALVVLKGSLLGLAAAHAVGVVHRDYKPANVVVQDDGQSKLVDFGIAVLAGQGDRSGTPAYMSPEQWSGQPASPATDLYAATCVFFETVTGRRPYAGDLSSLREAHISAPIPVDDVPEPVRPLVARGMAKSPGERLWNAERFVAELDAVAAEAYGSEWERRGRDILGAAAALFAGAFPMALVGAGAATAVETGIKGILAKIIGGKGAAAMAGTAATAVVIAWLLWPSEPYRPAWRMDEVTPVGSLEPVPGGFALYAVNESGGREVVSLDGRTGRIRWRQPAGPFATFAGDPVRPHSRGGTVLFQRRTENRGEVIATDAATGRVRWTHRLTTYGLYDPYWCGDTLVCFRWYDFDRSSSDALVYHIRVLDLATGRRLADSPAVGPLTIAPGVFDSVDHTELVRIDANARTLWRRTVRELFGSEAALDIEERRVPGESRIDIDAQVNWNLQLKDGRYIGQVGAAERTQGRRVRYLDRETVVAIDAATGRRLWAQPGAGLRCGRLTFTVDHPVRCRATGRLDLGYAPGTSLLQNVNVTLEGFDPATGATRWSWRAGAVRGLVLNEEHDESVIQVSDTTYLIRSETSGLTLLDLDSGPHPVQGPPPTGWCRGSVKLPRPVAEETSDLRYWPCDSEAKPVEMPGNVPHFAGTRSGDVFAWAERNRVQAVFID